MINFWSMIVIVVLITFFVNYFKIDVDPCIQAKDKQACNWVQGKY